MKLTQSQLKQIIKEEISEITQLPTDLDVPASEDELAMDALSAEYEEAARRSWFRTARVIDPFSDEGNVTDLDDFLALLGNRVISGDVTREEADKVVNNIEGYLA